jgi:hypothetical protein
MYMGCPITWASKIQTEIALSSTESEFIGLSQALRNTIPLMELIKELKAHGFNMISVTPKIHCKVFEDNSGAIEIANVPKMRPRTKHINIKYHHFRDYVERGEITIQQIASEDQPADMLTKPLNSQLINRHRKFIMGWTLGKLGRERECEETETTSLGVSSRSSQVNHRVKGRRTRTKLNPGKVPRVTTQVTRGTTQVTSGT